MKKLTAILLSLFICLSMVSCGQSAPTEETTVATESTSAADSFLTMAEELIAQEKYDSAIDVLNQAKQSVDDPRLDAMIAEIEAAKPVFLDVKYTENAEWLKTQGVSVHSVTAQVLEESVQYVIEYTAPAGMYLQVAGTSLDVCWDYLTPGGEDTFIFELDKQTACNHFQNLEVLFKYSYQNYLQLNITTLWPDAPADTLVQIPVANSSNADCSIKLATVQAVSEDMLHFHVEYFTPVDQQYYAGFAFTPTGEDTFFSVGVAPGDDMVSLMMSREDLESIESIYVRLWADGKWDEGLVAELRSSDYTLPQYVPAEAQEQVIEASDLFLEVADGQSLTIDSVLIQQTPEGNLLTMKGDFSGCASSTAYCDIGRLAYTVTTLIDTPEELQFFVPADIMAISSEINVEFWGVNEYVGAMPLLVDYTPVSASVLRPEAQPQATLEAPAPGQIVQYPRFSWENMLTHSEVEVYGMTETVLENGNIRYVLEYRATPGMTIQAFDPPNGEMYRFQREQPTSGQVEQCIFEVDKYTMDKLQYITLSFFSEMDEGNFFVYIQKNRYVSNVTAGNPVGEAKQLKTSTFGRVTAHSVTMQNLDNGFVRFTVDCTVSESRFISFFTPPDGDIFMYITNYPISSGRNTFVVDVLQESVANASEITINFFYGDQPAYHIYIPNLP